MYYKGSDIKKILEDIEEEYQISMDFDKICVPWNRSEHPSDYEAIEELTSYLRYQLISSTAISQVLSEIEARLDEIKYPDDKDYFLDVPTQCDGCFAQRDNGICWVCAFTGDLSESGFYEKYGIMENCPFLTQKQVDDLAYDFIQNYFETVHQEIIEDIDSDFRESIKVALQERFEEMWGGKSD